MSSASVHAVSDASPVSLRRVHGVGLWAGVGEVETHTLPEQYSSIQSVHVFCGPAVRPHERIKAQLLATSGPIQNRVAYATTKTGWLTQHPKTGWLMQQPKAIGFATHENRLAQIGF